MSKKMTIIDSEFESSVRKRYPFARSLYQATKLLNEEMKWIIGNTNENVFKTKKR